MINFLNPIKKELNKVEQYVNQVLEMEKGPLAEVYCHLLQVKGKYLRPALFLLAGRLGQAYSSIKFVPIAAAMEILHMATLVHDDIIDSGQVRRGKATINHLFGNGLAVLAGDSLFAKAFLVFSQQETPLTMQTMAQVVVSICNGETEQILNTYNIRQGEGEYLDRVGRKTASFFAASCYLGAKLTDNQQETSQALQEYGFNVGMAFQISDDYLDLVGEERKVGKTLGNDLQQGIMTLPIIYALKNSPYKERLKSIIAGKMIAGAAFNEALEIILESEALNHCQQIAGGYLNQAALSLSILPESKYKDCLKEIIDFIEARFNKTQSLQALT